MSARPLAEQFESIERQRYAVRFGVWVFLASETLLFAGLFALYAAYRVMYPAGFDAAAAHDDVLIGTSNTVILLTSSLAVALALHFTRTGRSGVAAWLLGFAVLLGLSFLVLKGVEYAEHFREGIFPGAHYHFAKVTLPGAIQFFTLYFLMTGLHALHVTAGMIMLVIAAVGCARRRYGPENYIFVEVGGLYWHLVDIVWIFLWPLLYLTHG